MASRPMVDGLPVRARARQKARFLVAASGLILVAHAVDVIQASGPNYRALAVRVAWAALILGNAISLTRAPRRVMQVTSAAAAYGTALLFLALLLVTGGSASPLFPFAFPLAIILPVFTSDLLWSGMGSAGVLLVGAYWLMVRDGASAAEQLGWGHAGAVALVVAWLLALGERRARRTAEALAREREEDLRRLAESERLAATGRLASEVAHQVNNPLAAAKASAHYLREGLRQPDEETAAAVDDLVGSLERIARLVKGLRQGPAAARPGEAPPASAAEGAPAEPRPPAR